MRVNAICFLLVSGCAISPSNSLIKSDHNFAFITAKSIANEVATEQEATSKFGYPSSKVKEKTLTKLVYRDSKTDDQRLTLTFNGKGKLDSVLWIPLPNEPEFKFENVRAQFPGLKLVKREEKSIDNLATVSTYSDKSTVTIFSDDSSQTVEAIAWYPTEVPIQAK